MRTTITLEPDAEAVIRKLMLERGLTFKQAVNQAIRGSRPTRLGEAPYRTPVFDMGTPTLPLDKATRLAADLEDEEILRKLAARK